MLRNTTDIPDDLIRKIVRHVCPPGVRGFDVLVTKGNASRAKAFPEGSGWHKKRCPFINIRLDSRDRFPFHWHDDPCVDTYSADEQLVFLIAHELRHLWQGIRPVKPRRGYYPRTRGRYSERDANCYALHALRTWRRESSPQP